jgi:hypothetical protein
MNTDLEFPNNEGAGKKSEIPTRVGASELIKILLEVIPEDQEDLRKELDTLAGGWWNIAPEVQHHDAYWNPVKWVLEKHIRSMDTYWKLRVRNIYNSGALP